MKKLSCRRNKGSKGGRPISHDKARYKQRNTVERCFQKIKTWRGLARTLQPGAGVSRPDARGR